MNLKYYKRYVKDIENVENFEKAFTDNFVGWCCHHRLETHTSDGERRLVDITMEELKALDMYYNRPASELIFLTKSEHQILHTKGKPKTEESKKKLSATMKIKYAGENNPMYGKHFSEETRKKLSEAAKGKYSGKNNPMYGKHHTLLSIQKMSEAKKGKCASEETKNKMSLQRTGRHWYNDGKVSKFCYECPDGFVPGRLR